METNPHLDHSMLTERYRDYLREIEHDRLCQLFEADKPKLLARMLAGLGDWLITLGQKLKAQHLSGSTF